VFSMVSGPPCLCGLTWSTSALLGRPEYSQSSPVRQRGQRVSPASSALALAWSRMRFHWAVPVREVAMFTALLIRCACSYHGVTINH
jgi:hypothetical protein